MYRHPYRARAYHSPYNSIALRRLRADNPLVSYGVPEAVADTLTAYRILCLVPGSA